MFGLVHFPDQTYGIYSMKNISKKKGDNNACIVKHRGAKYEAVLITEKGELFFYIITHNYFLSIENKLLE